VDVVKQPNTSRSGKRYDTTLDTNTAQRESSSSIHSEKIKIRKTKLKVRDKKTINNGDYHD